MYQGKIPFDKHGNQAVLERNADSWRPNEIFLAQLEPVRAKGPNVIVKDTETNAAYVMKLDDFIYLVKTHNIDEGKFKGTWAFKKVGAGFYLTPAALLPKLP